VAARIFIKETGITMITTNLQIANEPNSVRALQSAYGIGHRLAAIGFIVMIVLANIWACLQLLGQATPVLLWQGLASSVLLVGAGFVLLVTQGALKIYRSLQKPVASS
jgi:hypothetical protein